MSTTNLESFTFFKLPVILALCVYFDLDHKLLPGKKTKRRKFVRFEIQDDLEEGNLLRGNDIWSGTAYNAQKSPFDNS